MSYNWLAPRYDQSSVTLSRPFQPRPTAGARGHAGQWFLQCTAQL